MIKNYKKNFTSYREQLIDLAELYSIIEVKKYAKSKKRLTNAQLELILIKNGIKLPVNRSSAKVIEKQEIKENSITNIYLSFAFLLIVAGFFAAIPYIHRVVNEVKFNYIAEEYRDSNIKLGQDDKALVKEKIDKKEKKFAKKQDKKIKEYDNTVSLNAETTISLFQDLEYHLKDIRKGREVKPIFITKLPRDLNTLGNTSQKKELFIQIILPLILAENNKIISDREKLFKIINKKYNSIGERVWLKRRFKEYKVSDSDLSELKIRIDTIPVSLAIAQAAKESGWGTSRFALEGNALFGQWTWGKDGIVPKAKDPDKEFRISRFQILRASVRAYKNNLNTHNGYKEFREERAKLRELDKKINGLDLTKYLTRYAATGEEYVEKIELIIKQNSLTDFDQANLLSTRLNRGVAL